jgi:hypothetical protein
MIVGNTFVWCPPGTVKDHLWIVLTDPASNDGKCVVINLTDSRGGQFSHVLMPGQHRWIYKNSDVNYGDAFLSSESEINAAVASDQARPHDDMDARIVAEIVQRAKTHPAFNPRLRRFLPLW